MYYYQCDGGTMAALSPDLPLPRAETPVRAPRLFALDRPSQAGRTAFRPTHPRQLTAAREDAAFLDPRRIREAPPDLPPELAAALGDGALTAVNPRHPRWREALDFCCPKPGKRRLHLLAVGDVGGTVLTALKLTGGDCLSAVGICDLNQQTVARWVAEMSQVAIPWDYDALPDVEPVAPEELFNCDVFLFAAAKAIPPVGSGVRDVRMAQFEANRGLVEHYARQARSAGFRGLFLVMSDPVDPLCKAAYLASNAAPGGQWDGQGLLAEQIHGLGLGVMNARAAALARQNADYTAFLTEGRSFGPHGNGLVIANSVARYDDAVSRRLTEEVVTANLRIRELGFKPYVAPALSSGAIQILRLLRGQWHCGSVCLGDVWFGCRNRYTPCGLETEALELPDGLFARLKETEEGLRAII